MDIFCSNSTVFYKREPNRLFINDEIASGFIRHRFIFNSYVTLSFGRIILIDIIAQTEIITKLRDKHAHDVITARLKE